MATCSGDCGTRTEGPEYLSWLGIGGKYLCRSCARHELLELRLVVAKLPKTKDGVPVVPGARLYLSTGLSGEAALCVRPDDQLGHKAWGCIAWNDAYSTQEAAQAAGGK